MWVVSSVSTVCQPSCQHLPKIAFSRSTVLCRDVLEKPGGEMRVSQKVGPAFVFACLVASLCFAPVGSPWSGSCRRVVRPTRPRCMRSSATSASQATSFRTWTEVLCFVTLEISRSSVEGTCQLQLKFCACLTRSIGQSVINPWLARHVASCSKSCSAKGWGVRPIEVHVEFVRAEVHVQPGLAWKGQLVSSGLIRGTRKEVQST